MLFDFDLKEENCNLAVEYNELENAFKMVVTTSNGDSILVKEEEPLFNEVINFLSRETCKVKDSFNSCLGLSTLTNVSDDYFMNIDDLKYLFQLLSNEWSLFLSVRFADELNLPVSRVWDLQVRNMSRIEDIYDMMKDIIMFYPEISDDFEIIEEFMDYFKTYDFPEVYGNLADLKKVTLKYCGDWADSIVEAESQIMDKIIECNGWVDISGNYTRDCSNCPFCC